MSHVTHKWAMSHMNESCHVWSSHVPLVSHVPYRWVISHTNESCHICAHARRHSSYPHPQIRSHVTYEWVVSLINQSCHTWTSHVPYEWGMSHMNASCHIWTYAPMWHDAFICDMPNIRQTYAPMPNIRTHVTWRIPNIQISEHTNLNPKP